MSPILCWRLAGRCRAREGKQCARVASEACETPVDRRRCDVVHAATAIDALAIFSTQRRTTRDRSRTSWITFSSDVAKRESASIVPEKQVKREKRCGTAGCAGATVPVTEWNRPSSPQSAIVAAAHCAVAVPITVVERAMAVGSTPAPPGQMFGFRGAPAGRILPVAGQGRNWKQSSSSSSIRADNSNPSPSSSSVSPAELVFKSTRTRIDSKLVFPVVPSGGELELEPTRNSWFGRWCLRRARPYPGTLREDPEQCPARPSPVRVVLLC